MQQKFTSVWARQDVDRALIELVDAWKKIRISPSGLQLCSSGSTPHTCTALQAVFNERGSSPCAKVIHEIVIRHALAAERLGPGAFYAIIDGVIALVQRQMNITEFNAAFARSTNAGVRPCRRCDVTRIVAQATQATPSMTSVIERAVDLAGMGGKIVVDKSTTSTIVLELITGHTFELSSAFPLDCTMSDVRVIAIDGLIESVAEIHGVLEAANELHANVLLIARGMAPEVIKTLQVNHMRGTLSVVPFIVKLDHKGINTLNDIAVIAGGDVVSALKGELISSIKLESAPRIDSCIVKKDRLTLVNSATCDAVNVHVQTLRRKRDELDEEALAQLIDERLKTLAAKHVTVRLPDDSEFVRRSQAVDFALRGIAAAVTHGMVDDCCTFGLPKTTQLITLVGTARHLNAIAECLAQLGAVLTS